MIDDYYTKKFDSFTPMTEEQKRELREACDRLRDLDWAKMSSAEWGVEQSMEPMRRILGRIDQDVCLLVEAGVDPNTIVIAHFNDAGQLPAMGIMVAEKIVRKYQVEVVGLSG